MQVADRAIAHGTKCAVMTSANKTENKTVLVGHEVKDGMAGSNEGSSCGAGPCEDRLTDSRPVEGRLSGGRGVRGDGEEALSEYDHDPS